MGQAQDRLTAGGQMLVSSEVCKLLHISMAALTTWRQRGGGPPWVRVGKKYLYPEAEMWAWLETQNQHNNSKQEDPEEAGAPAR